MTTPQTATRQTNEAALCRALRNEAWTLTEWEGYFGPQTILENENRPIGIQLTGLRRGRVFLHGCPTMWKSKHALREAEAWVQRHLHVDLTGLTEV